MTMNKWTWLVLGLLAVTNVATHNAKSIHLESGADDDDEEKLTDDYAVEIDGGQNVADLVAATHGLEITRHIRGLGNVYVFSDTLTRGVSKRTSEDIEQRLAKDPNVQRIERQKLLRREKRVLGDHDIPLFQYDKRGFDRGLGEPESRAFASDDNVPDPDRPIIIEELGSKDPGIYLTDPRFKKQWYLANTGQTGGPAGKDLNVVPAWKRGFTGKGVVLTVLDDGIEHTHPDIKKNYDARASTDLNSKNDSDPMPNAKVAGNDHGTKCAGEIAAEANNSYCGAGIAFNAKIGGVRILDGRVTDSLEAHALLFNNQYIDIYSASWGPRDNARTMEAPGHYCSAALKKGAEEGRGGKGSIFVWASGNGRPYGDYCSCDGYVSSIYTTSFGSISDLGMSTYFSEYCPGNMAMVYTGGSHDSVGSANYRMPPIKVTTTDLGGRCTSNFQGTSSAAPLAGGCIALALQANPALTYRDVQHLIVETAKIPNDKEMGWTLNGGGKHVHPKFGFGVLDCSRLVAKAQKWATVKPHRKCVVMGGSTPKAFGSRQTIKLKLNVDGCKNEPEHRVDKIEHTQVTVNITHPYRGDVEMSIISPSGTKSDLLKTRARDSASTGIHFTFMTVRNWGESPIGEWTLIVSDSPARVSNRKNKGILASWTVTLWGTSDAGSSKRSPQLKSKTKNRAYEDGNEQHHVIRRSKKLKLQDVREVIARETSEARNVQIQKQNYEAKKKAVAENMEKKGQNSSPDAAFVDLLKNHRSRHMETSHIGSRSEKGYLKDTPLKQLREFVERKNNLKSLKIERKEEKVAMEKIIHDLEEGERIRKLIGSIEGLLEHKRETQYKRGYQSHHSYKKQWSEAYRPG